MEHLNYEETYLEFPLLQISPEQLEYGKEQYLKAQDLPHMPFLYNF